MSEMRRSLFTLALALLCLGSLQDATRAAGLIQSEEASRACMVAQMTELLETPDQANTVAGIIDYLDATEDRPFVRRTSVLCYRLGRQFAKLRRHWTSDEAAFELILSPDLEPHRDQLEAMASASVTAMRVMFQTEAPLKVPFYISNDFASIRRSMEADGVEEADINHAEQGWRGLCRQRGALAGFANAARLIVCIPDWRLYPTFGDQEVERRLRRLIAHEYVHVFQMQAQGSYSGLPYHEFGAKGWPGPKWLLEGFAVHASLRMETDLDDLIAQHRATLAPYKYGPEELCKIRRRQRASYERLTASKAAAQLAVAQLEHHAGPTAFAEFYAQLGFNLNWQQSFHEVFGGFPDEVLGCATQP